MSVIIQIKRDTLTNWESINPILALGEIGLIVDNSNNAIAMRIGDGVTTFSLLSDFNSSITPKDDTTTGTYTMNMKDSVNFGLTLSDNLFLANPINIIPNQSGWIEFIQDATGGFTPTFDTAWNISATLDVTTPGSTSLFKYKVSSQGKIVILYFGSAT